MASFRDQLVPIISQGLERFANSTLDRVTNNIPFSTNGIVSGRPSQKYSTENLEFPFNVASADRGIGNHGHYILFFINEQQNSKISFGKKQASSRGFANTLKAQALNGIASEVRTFVDKAAGGFFETVTTKLGVDNLIEGLGSSQSFTSAIAGSDEFNRGSVISESENTAIVKRPPTTRLDTAIALYMPPSVSVTYAANYTDTEIGGLAAAAATAFAEGGQGAVDTLMSDETNKDAIDAVKKMMLSTAGAVPGLQGAREVYEMQQGYIMTNRMDLAFKGLPKRGFQYTFKMIPKSEQEAEEVRNIVTAFKMNMLPEAEGASDDEKKSYTGKRLKIPNTFDIKYMYVGLDNQYLNKISTCVLENMNVTYGGSRYKTFDGNEDGAPPVETTMTLNFKEMELITKQRAEEGF